MQFSAIKMDAKQFKRANMTVAWHSEFFNK